MIKIKSKIIHKSIIYDDDGFTTLSVVVALLVCLALIFSTAQVYQINSASADIQSVSDSSALAAENEIAEFMILVRVVDSAILSLSLAGVISLGLAVVAMCTPVTFAASDSLLELSYKIFDARDSFCEKSSNVLNEMQRSLAFLATVKAYQIALANNGSVYDSKYIAISMLMPGEGVEIKPGNVETARHTLNEVQQNSDEIKKLATEAEEAAKKANESKQKAFMADCGNNPNYCMYERARSKAYMTGPDNPLYSSVDTWSFSVALKRCKAYYPKRLSIEQPEGSSVDAQANSALRKVFYSYATNQMANAYVEDNGDLFKANFPHLPKNTDEMKQTSMYSDPIFPISGNCMHAFEACPGCNGISGYGSLQTMDGGGYQTCPYCQFSASSLGKVAAASSSIDNGYEYHYSIVEKASKDYQEAKEKAAPLNAKVKNFANEIFEKLKNIISEIFNKRIYAKPPGSYGTITMVVNTNASSASKGFESSFVHNGANIGIRASVSAATLIEEESDEGKTVLNSILDGLKNDIPGFAGPVGIILNAWSKLLGVYNNGQDSFIEALESSLNQLPLMSASGLGTWASKAITDFMKDLGLGPAELNALKAVLINSNYVAKEASNDGAETPYGKASKDFAVKYLQIRDIAINTSESTNFLLSSISNGHELANALNLGEIINNGGTLEIAQIQPLGDLGPFIPITIKLPQFATNRMSEVVSWFAVTMQSILGDFWGGKVWR